VPELAVNSLDPTFGVDGKVVTSFGRLLDDGAASVAVQGDGKLVVAGFASEPGGDRQFAVARYAPDGSLDTTFGTGGKTTTVFPGGSQASGLAIQADGKPVVVGSSLGGLTLVRYTSGGALDGTFGAGGKVITQVGLGATAGHDVAVQGDGRVLAAGSADGAPGTGSDFALVRYTANGVLDPTFGNGGMVTTAFTAGQDFGNALAIQANGRIVVVGGASAGPNGVLEFAAARYLPNGSLDTTFGVGGKVTTLFSGNDDFGQDVAVQPDGRVVVAGRANSNANTQFAVVRYLPDGSLDAGFGTGGRVLTDLGSAFDIARRLVLQPDGKILVAGSVLFGANDFGHFALVRYLADGRPDGTFGDNGRTFTTVIPSDLGGSQVSQDRGFGLALQADGKPIVVGQGRRVVDIGPASGQEFTLARYLTERGLYQTIPAVRLLDTRNGTGAPAGKVGGGTALELQVTSQGGLPATGVGTVALNVTVTEPSAAGHLIVHTAGEARPPTSNLNFPAAATIANLCLVRPGTSGRVAIFNASSGDTHLVADLVGWHASPAAAPPAGAYTPVTPTRLLDTRTGTGAPASKVTTGSTLELQVTSRGGIPASGVGVAVLNITVVQPDVRGFLTAFPAAAPRPALSDLNFSASQTVATLAVVKIGAGGRVALTIDSFDGSVGSMHLVADVVGWFASATVGPAPGAYTPVTPIRLLDTRSGTGAPAGKAAGGTTLEVQVTSAGAIPAKAVRAVLLRVEAAEPDAIGFFTIFPTGTARPATSTLNFPPAAHNLAIATVGTGGKVSIFNGSAAGVHMVASALGWYADPTP
jgi:uncharacterized delta-60 repeat protein